MRGLIILAAAAALLPVAAYAQTEPPPLPDPATITVPDLSHSGDPAVVADGWKYFLFRREGVSFAEAHADFSDCYRFLAPQSWQTVQLGRFVPWESRAGRTRPTYQPNPYGLVGDLMLMAIEGTLARRDYQSKMRRCMETRGYIRYGVDVEIWNHVYKLPPAQSIAVQAKIASGPDFGGKVPTK